MPEEIIEADLTGDYLDLGSGPVFASRRINAMNLTRTHLRQVPQSLRRDILVFDWWIHNADRTLTEIGGNPNLLWVPAQAAALVMIDHNLAFDPDFNEEEFLQLHVFADEAPDVFSDFLLRDAYLDRFAQALKNWTDICGTLPEAWGFIDLEKTVPVDFPFDAIKDLLDRALTDAFWQLPPK